jgi:hypothetical protein
LYSCTSQHIASQQVRSLRGVTSGASFDFTASDSGIIQRGLHEDDDDSSVEEVDVVTEVVENRGYDGEFDENLILPAILPAPETPTDPTPTPHPKDGGDTDAAVAESPSPIAAPHHHKEDPTQAPTTVPKNDPTPAPSATATNEKKRTTDDDTVDNTAEEKETDDTIPTDDLVVPEEPRNVDDRPSSGEVTDDVPQEESSAPLDVDSNLPTRKPNETGQKEKDQIATVEDDLVAREDDDVLEGELKEEETETKVFGGFGFLITIVALVFTAHQMSENPDGIYASLCRLAITIASCVIKVVLMPFRLMLGHRGYHSGHMPISTTDPY